MSGYRKTFCNTRMHNIVFILKLIISVRVGFSLPRQSCDNPPYSLSGHWIPDRWSIPYIGRVEDYPSRPHQQESVGQTPAVASNTTQHNTTTNLLTFYTCKCQTGHWLQQIYKKKKNCRSAISMHTLTPFSQAVSVMAN